jgi:hypothetical protein
MSKKIKGNVREAPLSARRRFLVGSFIALVLVVIAVLGGVWFYLARNTEPGFEKLAGRWLRPDGGYVIAIRSVANDGAMDAAYFNPKPIHVARAEAFREAGATKVFIELRDVNYPGSTYTLTYNETADWLEGIYYQAVEKQEFEVYFERVK